MTEYKTFYEQLIQMKSGTKTTLGPNITYIKQSKDQTLIYLFKFPTHPINDSTYLKIENVWGVTGVSQYQITLMIKNLRDLLMVGDKNNLIEKSIIPLYGEDTIILCVRVNQPSGLTGLYESWINKNHQIYFSYYLINQIEYSSTIINNHVKEIRLLKPVKHPEIFQINIYPRAIFNTTTTSQKFDWEIIFGITQFESGTTVDFIKDYLDDFGYNESNGKEIAIPERHYGKQLVISSIYHPVRQINNIVKISVDGNVFEDIILNQSINLQGNNSFIYKISYNNTDPDPLEWTQSPIYDHLINTTTAYRTIAYNWLESNPDTPMTTVVMEPVDQLVAWESVLTYYFI